AISMQYLVHGKSLLGVACDVEIFKKISTNRLTLRLQSDLLEVLKQSAHKKDLTLNAMITNILHKNVAYDETVNVLPHMMVSHDLFFSIVSKISESDMSDIAKEGPCIVKKLFDIMGLPYDIDHVIYNYFVILDKYCRWFEFSHKSMGNNYRLVFCTGSNSKWSIFVQKYVRIILESLKIMISRESHHGEIIVFEFSHKIISDTV
ncbi:MAG: hypothetical protein ACREBJ_07100, partial [Nitrosotalea sp.]